YFKWVSLEDTRELLTLELEYGHVLDVGCGNGQSLIAFSKESQKVYGIEPDSSLLSISRKNLKEHNVEGVHPIQAFAEYLPFKDESFDLIFCRVVLMYTDKEKAMAEFSRVLKKNGKIFISIDGLGYYLGCIVDGIKSRNFHRAYYGLYTIIRTVLYRKLLKIKGQYTTTLTFGDLRRLYQRYGDMALEFLLWTMKSESLINRSNGLDFPIFL
ncbi:MAG: class I SAM-dependent methyltransferase, partial [bacterium]|nr:class I SAM-dependent methyltransferase [bacterium]